MSLRVVVVRRLAFAVIAAYLVMTAAFGIVALTADPGQALLEYQLSRQSGVSDEEIQEELQEYREERNLDDPVLERYQRWLVGVTTLDWGQSFTNNAPVTGLIRDALWRTAQYVLPAMVLSLLAGLSAGVYAALTDRPSRRGGITSAAYLAFGVPNFWLGKLLIALVTPPIAWAGYVLTTHWPLARLSLEAFVFPSVAGVLNGSVFPVLVLSTSLTVGLLRYTQSEVRERVGGDFVKLLRAKGASNRRVARHLLRNAAIPLTALFVTDLLAILVVNVYIIEFVFGISGFGMLSYRAIFNRDLPLVLGTTMTIAFVGIAANVLQDVTYSLLDPRVETE